VNKQEINIKLKSMIGNYLPYLKANNYFDNINGVLFLSINEIGSVVKVLTQEEWDLFYAPIEFMLSQKNISKNYSEEFIQDKFVKLYHKMLEDESKLDMYIDNLLDLFYKPAQTFFIISELENIRILDDQEYEIIDSTIKIMKQEDLSDKGKSFIILGEKMVGKNIIFTKVQAGDYDKAEELATYNFIISLSLLRLYFPSFKPTLGGYPTQRARFFVGYNEMNGETTISTPSTKDTLLNNNASLDNKLYNLLLDAGIGELKNPNTISKVVKDCLYWFGLGLEEEYPSAKLLDFVVVLESLLKKKDENTELNRAISERGAILLYDGFEERKKAAEDLKKIYKKRSEVIHTGTSIEEKDVVSLSSAYARAALQKVIKMSKDFGGDFEKFIDYLDDMKLKGKTNNA
jgi:hypothetical protein